MQIRKIKITLIVFFGLIVLSFAVLATAEENSITNKNIFLDSDQDGLSNDEEKAYGTNPNNADSDGDGYTDGVEISSGYDPLKPSPGDKIVASSENSETAKVAGSATEKNGEEKNLTENLSQKVTELITTSQTENKEITIEDIDKIIEETTAEELTFDDLPEIDEKTIKIKEQDYSSLSEEKRNLKETEDAQKYFTAVAYILATNSPQQISSSEDMQSFSETLIKQVENISLDSPDFSYFDELIEKEKNVLKQMEEVEIPEQFLDIHKRGLQLANYAITLRSEEEIDTKDPVKSMVYFSKINNLISLSDSLANEISPLLEKYGITGLSIGL